MLTQEQVRDIKLKMNVLDINGNPVGKVAFVFQGKNESNLEFMGLRDMKIEMQTLMGNIADFPLAVYARFYRDGFVRIQAGQHAVYFIPEQIHVVVGDKIHLRVAREDLLSSRIQ